ncbi:MAG: S24 family peptidase [Desulfuromonadaceae bacterium]|nr:S24 family peptidase [Desulfuromonadaceae bacterium]MDD2849204.1 S24 family peptidase [Desulfuromonadaceae bacterium]MDD4129747.1 S24 family peptidase [Desulfuromonadaceae bacterium]
MSNFVNKKVLQLHDECINTGNEPSETLKLRMPGGNVLINTKDTLGRIKEELDIQTDVELAEAMEVGIRRIHNWKQRNTIPTEAIVAICGSEGLDLEYILTGNKSHAGRFQSEENRPPLAVEQQQPVCEQPRVSPPDKRFVRYDSRGNVICSFESAQIVDVLSPGVSWLVHALGVQPEDLLLMKVLGDSMYPWAQDGDLVFVDTSCKNTINGGVLALRYADGTMSIRRIFRSHDGTLLAKCDAVGSEPEVLDISNEDIYPLVVGRVVRRLVR